MLHPPKFWTPRDEAYPTRGGIQDSFARVWLGKPLMPAQRLIADVMGEYDPDTGLPRRTLWVITEQRQAGKSHLAMAQNGERCFTVPNYRAWYTAQTGKDARQQFLKFNDEIVAGTPLAHAVHTLRGNGNEVMTFLNGSTIAPHPPNEEALHGKQVDRDDIDEGWAFTVEEGKALLAAAAPAKLTRPGAITVIWSAGGTPSSTWLASLMARGRAGDPTLGYIEFGVPDDLDMDDLQTVAEYHPSYRCEANPHGLVTVESIRALRDDLDDPEEFKRAAGNKWTDVIGGGISEADWAAMRTDVDVDEGADVAYGAARAVDGSHVVVCAAARVHIDGQARTVVEVLDILPAFEAGGPVAALVDWGQVAVWGNGASGALVDDLTRKRARVARMAVADTVTATSTVLDSIAPRGVRFRPHPALDAAVGAAGLRSVGAGGKVWAPIAPTAPIAALEAATAAVWSLTHDDHIVDDDHPAALALPG